MSTEVFTYNADIDQLMSLIINNFYSKKEIFLRELISNASDAIEKIRYQSLTDKTVLDTNTDLKIKISVDKENNTFTIQDSGIGMSRDELINNLGTLAKSGTKAFAQTVQDSKNIDQIGQFGVGFYSAFLVADKVEVHTKQNDDEQYVWISEAEKSHTFEINKDESEDIKRGTKIVLYLKSDQLEFLDEQKIRELVKTHSQFIGYPIELYTTKTIEEEVVDDEVVEEKEDKPVREKLDDGPLIEEVDDEEEEKKPKMKTISTEVSEWEHLNQQKPIWTQSPDDVTLEEYNKFYKSFTNDTEDFISYKHFKTEGSLEFKSILFLPKKPEHNFMQQDKKNSSSIKLYVKRVLILEKCNDLLPEYLSFVKGVVDSDDLPLNVSRELLQQNRVLKQIKNNLTKKAIDLMIDLMNDNALLYQTFYEQYSKYIKLGVYEDSKNKDKLCSLLRYSHSNDSVSQITLNEYIKNMKEDQQGIYYLCGENIQILNNSPFTEGLKHKGYDILYMTDPIDEYMLQNLKEFSDKKFVCVTKDNLKLDEDEALQKEYEDVCNNIKTILDSKLDKVTISSRLNESPCILVTNEFGWTSNMERIMKAQALHDTSMDKFMKSGKSMEINPSHKIMKTLKTKTVAESKEVVNLLYETALLNSGFSVEEPRTFADRIHRMVEMGFCEDVVDEQVDKQVDEVIDEVIDEEESTNDMEAVD
jgi:molecular chaperone HtpG